MRLGRIALVDGSGEFSLCGNNLLSENFRSCKIVRFGKGASTKINIRKKLTIYWCRDCTYDIDAKYIFVTVFNIFTCKQQRCVSAAHQPRLIGIRVFCFKLIRRFKTNLVLKRYDNQACWCRDSTDYTNAK